MPKPKIAKMAKLIMLATTLSLSAFSLNAQAKLTSITTSDGTELVYSSVSDVTWTKDANLLGTWLRSSTDADGNGTTDIIDAIVQATYNAVPSYLLPILKPQIDQYVNAAAFNDIGTATWYGANAFVTYLNSINYGGSNQWYLPSHANNGAEFAELFYDEFSGIAFSNIPNTNTFDNEQFGEYWLGTQYSSMNPDLAFVFDTGIGLQSDQFKNRQSFVWAVTPGRISAVPEPESVVMMLVSLGLMAGVVRRKQKSFA